MKLTGLKGEIFEHDGRVAGAVPPLGQPDAIPFEVLQEYPSTCDYPSWADMHVGEVLVRINPEICEPPWFRMFDCLAVAAHRSDDVKALDQGDTLQFELGGTPYVFWPQRLAGRSVVMIDTLDRVTRWHA